MKYLTKQTLKIYLEHAAKYKLLGIAALVFACIGPALNAVVPLFYADFFNLLTQGKGASGELLHLLFWMILPLLLLRHLVRRLAAWASLVAEARVQGDLMNTCFAYLHRHSITFFNSSFVGSLVKQVNYFSRSFEAIADRIVWFLLPLAVELAAMIGILLYRDVRLGLLFAGWFAFFVVVNSILTKYKMRYDVERNVSESAAIGYLADTITNQSNVKLFVGYDRERSGFRAAIAKVTRLRLISWNIENVVDAVQGFLTIGLEIAVMVFGIHLWQKGVLTPGDFIVLQAYLMRVFDKVWDFGKNIRGFYENLADAEDMTKILTAPYEITDAPGAKPLAVPLGEITFRNVTFNYHQTREVLSDFSLALAPHEKVALVGPSGAGKSTIVRLLLRLHDVTQGAIAIDGQEITRVTQESLWNSISFVPQDPILFHRTLMENIRYGKLGATNEEVIAAAKLAHCHEFISDFPDGYETYVGERGVKLSGGERQRVAIARAILRNAPILVLDEATSSLDSESERLIQDALSVLMKEKTVVVIAHRLSTIMKMDRIVVIDGGNIVEEGKHAELLQKQNGLYRRLWEIQAGGFIG